jgi:hypothetical protein
MRRLQELMIQARSNRDENESYYVLVLQRMLPRDREGFHMQLLGALFGLVDPGEFKTLCAMISLELEAHNSQGLSIDPKGVN